MYSKSRHIVWEKSGEVVIGRLRDWPSYYVLIRTRMNGEGVISYHLTSIHKIERPTSIPQAAEAIEEAGRVLMRWREDILNKITNNDRLNAARENLHQLVGL